MNFQKELERDRHKAKHAVRDFVQGAASANLARMQASLNSLDYGKFDGGGWTRAMRTVARLKSVPSKTRKFFLRLYIDNGDHIREECDDLALADGLRVLLPKYRGPAMRLYRGESASNLSRRTYGLSWTRSEEVARAFAETGPYRTFVGGSVLLEAHASENAIICAPALLADRYKESEYIVDRRRLKSVRAIDRFPQLSDDKPRELQRAKRGAIRKRKKKRKGPGGDGG